MDNPHRRKLQPLCEPEGGGGESGLLRASRVGDTLVNPVVGVYPDSHQTIRATFSILPPSSIRWSLRHHYQYLGEFVNIITGPRPDGSCDSGGLTLSFESICLPKTPSTASQRRHGSVIDNEAHRSVDPVQTWPWHYHHQIYVKPGCIHESCCLP